MNIGLYSAHGLKNIGFMYGFGMRNEFYIKRLLLDHFELKNDTQDKDISEQEESHIMSKKERSNLTKRFLEKTYK